MTKIIIFYVILDLLTSINTFLHICTHTFTHLLQISYAANYDKL